MGANRRDATGDLLLSGRKKLGVIRALAAGASNVSIASEYGCTSQAVTIFRRRNKREIDDIRDKLDDDYAGLWIAKKRDRIAELQSMAEILEEAIAQCPVDSSDMIRARAGLLKQASEELGQLPPRQQVVSAQVTHVVQGFTSDELKDILT